MNCRSDVPMWFLIIDPIEVHRKQNGKTCAEMTYENGAVLNGNCAVVNDAQIKNGWIFFCSFVCSRPRLIVF